MLSDLDSPSPGDLSVCIRCAGFSQFDNLIQIAIEAPKAYAQLMASRDAVRALEREGDRT